MAIRVWTRDYEAAAFVEAANQPSFNSTVRLAIAAALRSRSVTDCLIEDDAATGLAERMLVLFAGRLGREP